MKVLLLSGVAALALSALVASAAAASVVPAKFSTPSFKLTTSGMTIKKNGTEARTCTPAGTLEGYGESGSYVAFNTAGGETRYWCPFPAELTGAFHGEAKYDTETGRYYLTFADDSTHSFLSPFGNYWQETRGTSTGTWVNGSGTAPSTLTFSDQTIGYTFGGARISISGTFTVKSSAGGLITLSH